MPAFTFVVEGETLYTLSLIAALIFAGGGVHPALAAIALTATRPSMILILAAPSKHYIV
jgi:hypothetical protein